ncbi:coxsackievirus and adenovirus receptor homolog isoform X2 [Labrus mixtus]|uniref:coxsackievirus and adenovirus receptor homolog isoform X2 n=2 Tax=Labrus mixtus TaxID=508554 RepID=UPI0029C0B250|nr:coxsackievirus and adenovirus receptor homolog isoform X2 [Labrus mixtus]
MCLCLFSSVSSHRKKMMYRILLLLMMTCCDCGTFKVKVTQSFYQAEENQDVTLEWTFTPQDDPSLHSLFIYCLMYTDFEVSRLFRLNRGVEVSESQDEQFAGRVHWDKDVLKEGRLRLHVSSLRTEDSGIYECKVMTEFGVDSTQTWLDVIASTLRHKSETGPETGPETEPENEPETGPETGPERFNTKSWGWMVLSFALSVSAVRYVLSRTRRCFAPVQWVRGFFKRI